MAQQLREAFPENAAARYLVHDRNHALAALATTASGMGIQEVGTAVRSPWQNAYAECVIEAFTHDEPTKAESHLSASSDRKMRWRSSPLSRCPIVEPDSPERVRRFPLPLDGGGVESVGQLGRHGFQPGCVGPCGVR
jgi:hypothetical protein